MPILINKKKTENMANNINFTQVQETVDAWINEVNHDLQADWNDDKQKMQIQLQNLLIVKANLENIKQTGGQIFSSSISI
jgi:transposase-like protein